MFCSRARHILLNFLGNLQHMCYFSLLYSIVVVFVAYMSWILLGTWYIYLITLISSVSFASGCAHQLIHFQVRHLAEIAWEKNLHGKCVYFLSRVQMTNMNPTLVLFWLLSDESLFFSTNFFVVFNHYQIIFEWCKLCPLFQEYPGISRINVVSFYV